MAYQRPQIATFALRRLRPMDRDGGPRPAGPRWGVLLVMAALVGALLAVVLAGFLVFGSRTGTASVAAQHFCDALTQRDYATAYADLSQPLQRQGSETQFAGSQTELDRQRGQATACTFIATQVSGPRASFTLRVTRASGGALRGALHMVLEHGEWKVADYDSNVI
jgi:hypothetical protein